MIYEPIPRRRVLAVDPVRSGFGYVILEDDPLRLVDWGVVSTGRRAGARRKALARLIDRYHPTVLVLEAPDVAPEARRRALGRFLDQVADLVVARSLHVRAYSAQDVRVAFAGSGAVTRHEVATVLAAGFPEVAARLPRPRQPWESDALPMAIFDALALAVAHLSRQ
jgi:Holliday junction resolvasome RuvABC endonuclease subunit